MNNFDILDNNEYLNSSQSLDFFVVVLFLVFVPIYALIFGKSKLVILILSTYASVGFVSLFPETLGIRSIAGGESSSLKLLMFFTIFLVIFILLSRYLSNNISRSEESRPILHTLTYAFLHTGLMLSVVFLYLPEDSFSNSMPVVKELFSGGFARFFWFAAPLLAIGFLKNRKKAKKSVDTAEYHVKEDNPE